jgi:putative copper resistance protein D
MEQEWHIIAWFAATRTVHFFACLLVFGVGVFDRFVVAVVPEQERDGILKRWRSIAGTLVLIALPLALVSGASWFVLVAIQMSGLPPGEAVHLDILQLVWSETQFGNLWRLRAIFWLATAIPVVALVLMRRESLLRGAFTWLALALGGLLAASLAWSGHGQTGGPVEWHLAIDVLHILVIGFWPIGLLPLASLLFAMRKSPAPEKWVVLAVLVRRFSTISLASVALLAASGLGNSWFLVGSVPNLIGTTYGRILLIKLGVFCAMVAVGAVNLLYLKPRLSTGEATATQESAAARLRFNVLAEIAFGSAILILVGLLGLLPPAIEPMPPGHHHHPTDESVKASNPSWIIRSHANERETRGSDRETAKRLFGGVPEYARPGRQPTWAEEITGLSIVKQPHRPARRVAANLASTRAPDIAACRFRGASRRESTIEIDSIPPK